MKLNLSNLNIHLSFCISGCQQALYEMPLNSNLAINIFSTQFVQKTSSRFCASILVCVCVEKQDGNKHILIFFIDTVKVIENAIFCMLCRLPSRLYIHRCIVLSFQPRKYYAIFHHNVTSYHCLYELCQLFKFNQCIKT